jgi:hypothetical protein
LHLVGILFPHNIDDAGQNHIKFTGTDVSEKPGASIFHFEDELKITWKEVIVA